MLENQDNLSSPAVTAPVGEMPDLTGQKMTVSAGHRVSWSVCFTCKKTRPSTSGRSYFAILRRRINLLRRSDPVNIAQSLIAVS